MKRMAVSMLGILAAVFGLGSNAEARAFTFPEMPGWTQSGEIQTFVPKTLYEYINGASDLYLAYDFQELNVAEYSNETKASVIVEVYQHRDPTLAFGIYSQERLPDGNFQDIGAQGYGDRNILNFVSGSFYVKINSFNTGEDDPEILRSFAKKMADSLDQKGTSPSILNAFPAEGKKSHSEKFIARNFLGYSFFHSAFTADYEVSGKKFKLFLIENADGGKNRDMVRRYLQQTKSPDKEVIEGRYLLSDPHHGVVELSWKGKYLWGVVDLAEPDLRSKVLTLFEEQLKKRGPQ